MKQQKEEIKPERKQDETYEESDNNVSSKPPNLPKMQTVLNANDSNDEISKLSKACAALQRYYHSLNTKYYKDLQKYVEDNTLDIEGDLDQEPEDSDIVDFDKEYEEFPYPQFLKNENESIKQRFKFDIIKKCYYNPNIIFDNEYSENRLYPKCLLSTTTIKELYNINEEEFKMAEELYEEQCKAIWYGGGMQLDNSLTYLAAISIKYKFDYIQYLALSYQRWKIEQDIKMEEEAAKKKQTEPVQNVNNGTGSGKDDDESKKDDKVEDFCAAVSHIKSLNHPNVITIKRPWEFDANKMDVDNSTNPGTAYDVVKHGIHSYGKRCIPYMVYTAPWAFNDSLEITTRYILSCMEFINMVIADSEKSNKVVTPFQIDYVIAYEEPIPIGSTT